MPQVIGHLLGNALKFTKPSGGMTLGAEIESHGDLLVRIPDSGIGIAAADLQRVREPSVQLDASFARRFQDA